MQFVHGGPYEPMGMDGARAIAVIETTIARRGKGVEGDPIRLITQYWSMDGQLLAERDPAKE